MPWGKKKKDELSKKRDEKAKVPYVPCGHKRTYKRGTAEITVICQKNRNVRHSHD